MLFVGVEQQEREEEFVGRGEKRELGDFVVSIAGEYQKKGGGALSRAKQIRTGLVEVKTQNEATSLGLRDLAFGDGALGAGKLEGLARRRMDCVVNVQVTGFIIFCEFTESLEGW